MHNTHRLHAIIRITALVLLLGLFATQTERIVQAFVNGTCNSQGNGDWNNPAIWSCGYEPASGDTARIEAANTVSLVTDRNINTLNMLGTLQMQAKTLRLWGDMNVAASAVFTGGGNLVAVGSNQQICGGTPPNLGSTNVTIDASFTTTCALGMTTAGDLTTNFGTTILGGPSSFGAVGMYSGSALTLNSDLSVSGNWRSDPAGLFTPNTATVTFNRAGAQSITSPGADVAPFYNLAVGGASTLSTLRNVTTNNDLSIAAGGALALGANLTVGGNLSNAGTFTPGTNTVTFNKAGTQTITGNTNFYGLVVGGSSILSTSSAVSYTNITRSAGSQTAETRAIGATGSQAFSLADATVNVSTLGTLSALQVSRKESAHTNAPSLGSRTLDRYLTFTPTGSDFTTEVCLNYTDAEVSAKSMLEDNLHLFRWMGSAWLYTTRGTNSDTTANRVCADEVKQFSDWIIAEGGPTAVSITGFTSHSILNSGVTLAWSTLAETDTVGFYIERAAQGSEDFARITPTLIAAQHPGQLLGGGYRYTDFSAAPGKSYRYQLVLLDSQGFASPSGLLDYAYPYSLAIPFLWR